MLQKQCLPIYMQIAEDIKRNISGRKFAPGTLLPTEFELAEQYGVSRPTLRNALAYLEKEGYIQRKKFTGTIVSPDALRQKYQRLDLGFFTRLDLTQPDAYTSLFSAGPWWISHVLREGVRKGYFVRFFPWQYPAAGEVPYDLEEVLFRKGVDAFVISSPMYLTGLLDTIRENRVPHVALESHYDKPGVNTVMFDDEVSMREEFQTLWELGHRKIAFLGGQLKLPELNSQTRRFYDLFIKNAQEFGLSLPEHWIQTSGAEDSSNIAPDIKAMTRNILRNPAQRPTAIICAQGRWVQDVMETAAECGLKVPEELSVITPFIYETESPEHAFSGHYADLELISQKAYQEIHSWLKNPSYRPSKHIIIKKYFAGKTAAPLKK